MRDLRGRVKAARAVVASTPRLAEILANDWRKAATFYARLGIIETRFRNEVTRSQATMEGEIELTDSVNPVKVSHGQPKGRHEC